MNLSSHGSIKKKKKKGDVVGIRPEKKKPKDRDAPSKKNKTKGKKSKSKTKDGADDPDFSRLAASERGGDDSSTVWQPLPLCAVSRTAAEVPPSRRDDKHKPKHKDKQKYKHSSSSSILTDCWDALAQFSSNFVEKLPSDPEVEYVGHDPSISNDGKVNLTHEQRFEKPPKRTNLVVSKALAMRHPKQDQDADSTGKSKKKVLKKMAKERKKEAKRHRKLLAKSASFRSLQ